MSNEYGRRLLEKHGWKDGCGLGKDESGIKEALKVTIKNDTTGVGHDPGEQYNFHWWDHVFNKAANSIKVTNTQNGVLVGQADNASPGVDIIDKLAKTYDSKSTLYTRFKKAGTLKADGETTVLVREEKSGDSDDDHTDLPSSTKLTEEQIFAKCGGRTAHRAARHGHKLNGKLLRVQEQDKRLFELQNTKNADLTTDNKLSVLAASVPSLSADIYLNNPAGNALSEFSSVNSVLYVNSTDKNTGDQGDCSLKQDRKRKKKEKKKKRQLVTSSEICESESDISHTWECSNNERSRTTSERVSGLNGNVVNETTGYIKHNSNLTDLEVGKVSEPESDIEMKIRVNKSAIVEFLSKHSDSDSKKSIYPDAKCMIDCDSNPLAVVHNGSDRNNDEHQQVKKKKKCKTTKLSMDISNEKHHHLLDTCDPGTDIGTGIVKKKRKKTKITCHS